MKLFETMTIREAYAFAKEGGQALHLFDGKIWGNPSEPTPSCFRRTMKAGKMWAHLFDQDKTRLIATAKRLGVRVIVVSREGNYAQHIDLCGRPLERALAECCLTQICEQQDRIAERKTP